LRDVTNAELLDRHLTVMPPVGAGPAKALWLKGHPCRDPYYWAGFTVFGDALERRG
jgi:hypothetical protein